MPSDSYPSNVRIGEINQNSDSVWKLMKFFKFKDLMKEINDDADGFREICEYHFMII